MNTKLIGISVVIFSVISFFAYATTHAFLTDSASATANTFATASEFSTPTSGEEVPTNTPTPTPSETPTPTPTNIATHLVISEVQISGSNTDQDFVEFYNPTSNPIDLNGMLLAKRTAASTSDTFVASWSATTIVQPNSYYLLASNIDSTFFTTLNPDASFSAILSINNSIALRQGQLNTGTIIDGLGWGSLSGTPFTEGTALTSPTANHSLERKANSSSDTPSMTSGADINKGNGYDTENNADDFVTRTTSQPQNSSSASELP